MAVTAERPWVPGRVPHPAAVVGGCVLAALLAAAVLGRSAAPYDPDQISGAAYQPPSRAHLLGTNDLGQDIFSEVVVGARSSLGVGVSVAALSTALAWMIGVLGGIMPRGEMLALLGDLLLVLPALPLLVLLTAYVGPSAPAAAITLGVLSWPAFARVIRAQVLSTKEREYVVAALAMGSGLFRIMARHIIPETIPIIVTKFVLTLRWAVLIDANLAFLGLADPASASWGNMLNHAFRDPLLFTRRAWLWSAGPPALAIAALVVTLAFVAQLTERREPRVLPES
jgi:peptide/nickel transport system permease protein